MIDYHRLKNWAFPEIEHHYTADDTMRYALALGLGSDPMDARQLQYVTETTGALVALPSMAVVLGYPGAWMQDLACGIDYTRIVHGEEHLVMHRPLPVAGTVRARHRVTRVVDKGEGRGAIVTYDKDLFDAADGALLATVTHTTFARANGGFSAANGLTDEAPPAPAKPPEGTPDHTCEIATLPQQALLYRLCADRNPLHAQPEVAQAAGFARPILHGLCTWGIACRALLATCADDKPERLRSLFARFSSPVFPGETLRFEIYGSPADLRFRAVAQGRGVTVLDAGRASFSH